MGISEALLNDCPQCDIDTDVPEEIIQSLKWVAKNGHLSVLNYLLNIEKYKTPATENDNLVNQAINQGQEATVKRLLEFENVRKYVADRGVSLGVAAKIGHLEILNCLLEIEGVTDIKSLITNGDVFALYWACVHQHPHIVNRLLEVENIRNNVVGKNNSALYAVMDEESKNSFIIMNRLLEFPEVRNRFIHLISRNNNDMPQDSIGMRRNILVCIQRIFIKDFQREQSFEIENMRQYFPNIADEYLNIFLTKLNIQLRALRLFYSPVFRETLPPEISSKILSYIDLIKPLSYFSEGRFDKTIAKVKPVIFSSMNRVPQIRANNEDELQADRRNISSNCDKNSL